MSDSDPVRVLVVDDDRVAADQLGDFFDFPGVDVRVAYSASEALQHVDFEPQLIFIDDSLADLNVYELAKTFRQHPSCESSVIVDLVDWKHPCRPPGGRPCAVDHFLNKQVIIELPASLADHARCFENIADRLPITDLQQELQRLYPRLRPRNKHGDAGGSPASDQSGSNRHASDGRPAPGRLRADDEFLKELERCLREDFDKALPPERD